MNRRSIFFIIVGIFLVGLIAIWFLMVIPFFSRIPNNFSYRANISSVDNFYDEATGESSEDQHSVTRFSYAVVSTSLQGHMIESVFDVRTPEGQPIISLRRLYGINPVTGAHVVGLGDKNRNGYLFAPHHLKEGQDFTYWHINYDAPALMKFVQKETLYGLTVFRYEADYAGARIDQTANLTNLPGVPDIRGVELEPHLTLWVEPATGWLVKYQDKTTAYFYNIKTGARLNPWNKFSNTYSEESVRNNVAIASAMRSKTLLVEKLIPGFLLVVALLFFLLWLFNKKVIYFLQKRDAVTLVLVIVTFGGLMAGTYGIFSLLKSAIRNEVQTKFEGEASRIASLIQDRMVLNTSVLHGLQGLFSASNVVEEREWIEYARAMKLNKNYPGITALTYIKRVFASSSNSLGFNIYPTSTNSELFPVTYYVADSPSGLITISTAIGFDIGSEKVRATALRKAQDTGLPVATGIVLAITNRQPSFSVYGPVYRNDQPTASKKDRQENLVGFVAASFRVKDLFAGFVNDPYFDSSIDLEVYDTPIPDAIGKDVLVFDSDGSQGSLSATESNKSDDLSMTVPIIIGGRIWQVHFHALSGFTSFVGVVAPTAILVVGIIISFLLAIVIFSFSRSRERAEKIAHRATRELEQSQYDLSTFLDNLTTFAAKVDASTGKVVFGNAAAKAASGLGEKFVGTDFLKGSYFTFDPSVSIRVNEAYQKVLLGESVNYDEAVQLATPKGKKVFDINLSMIPVKYDGVVKYVIAEGRDITADKKIEKSLEEKTSDLERFNKLMVDRELKMIELKKQLGLKKDKI